MNEDSSVASGKCVSVLGNDFTKAYWFRLHGSEKVKTVFPV